MTREQKELLLKDLCARLPYGVKGINEYGIISSPKEWKTEYTLEFAFLYRIEKYNWRPYLFPMSSMTLEQRCKVQNLLPEKCEISFNNQKITFYGEDDVKVIQLEQLEKIFNLFNLFHVDYRGLIPMGLAIDATDKNIY